MEISLTLAEAIFKDVILIKNIVIIIVTHYDYGSILDVFLFIRVKLLVDDRNYFLVSQFFLGGERL